MEQQYDWAALTRKIQDAQFLTQKGFADRCKVSPSCVNYWINVGREPGFVMKRKLLEIARQEKIDISKYEIASKKAAIEKYRESRHWKELVRIFEFHSKMKRRRQIKLLRYANALPDEGKQNPEICKAPECCQQVFSKGYCRRHYNHLYRYGHIKDATVFEPNRIDIRDDVASIHLRNPQGDTRRVALIDAGDVETARKHMWKLDSDAVIAKGYMGGRRYHFTLPRLLLGLKDDGTVVTHANSDILDCRRTNLITADRAMLNLMSKIPTTNKSGYKGVCRTGRKWHAYLHVGGRKISGGSHANLQDAVEVRKRLEAKYFGEVNRVQN